MDSILNLSKQADIIAEKEEKQLVADHHYDVIYPIIRDSDDLSKREWFDTLSKKEYINPKNNQVVMYSASTIKRWYYEYINSGNKRSALMTKQRNDIGKPRVLTKELCEAIIELKEEHKYMSATKIHEVLVVNGDHDASLRTISEFIKKQGLNHKVKHNKQRLPFEAEYANSVWYGDTNYGPFIKINGQSARTYLIALIDDASRLIVGARYYLADNAINVQATMKDAIMRWGVSDLHYFDQGTPYKGKQLSRIIRSIGSNIKHAAPYSPQSKARVERFFRTLDTRWLDNVNTDSFESLEHLNQELDIYINEYNNTVHSAIGTTPLKRWMKDKDRIRYIDENDIDAHFLHMLTRKVRNDTTIQIDKVSYQLPEFAVKHIGKQINVFFIPDIDQQNIEYMVSDGKEYVIIKKVDKIANGKRFIGTKGINDQTKPEPVPKMPQAKLGSKDKAASEKKEKNNSLSYGGRG